MKTIYVLPFLVVLFLTITADAKTPAVKRHNIVMVVLNDIGPWDLNCYGNKTSVTPYINLLFEQSQRAENYHAYPISSPTWAAMMTGLQAEKVGVRRNYGGLQLPRATEPFVSQMLQKTGYKTAFFGRWPFGDCYPYRTQDRGFDTSLVTGAGGIGRPGDAWGNSSINPYLKLNGKLTRFKGYMIDVLFDTAIQYIDKNKTKPFFVVIAPNEAGAPFQPDPKIVQAFIRRGIPEKLAMFHAQLAMIDTSMGKLMEYLSQNGLDDNTVLIFTSTSGGIGGNIASKFTGRTGDTSEGGHRTLFWMKLPKLFKENIGFDRLCYCADITPTILELANVAQYDEQRLDGISLVSGFATGGESMPHRKIIINLHKGEYPTEKLGSIVMFDQWRLIDDVHLYNMADDPEQKHPREYDQIEIRDKLKIFYDLWYKDIRTYYDPKMECSIPLVSPDGKPVELNCYDWRGSNEPPMSQAEIYAKKSRNGYWLVDVPQSGTYEFRMSLRPSNAPVPIPPALARLQIGKDSYNVPLDGKQTYASVSVTLKKGRYRLQTWIIDTNTRSASGAYFVTVIKK